MLALTINVLKSNNYLATNLSCEVDKENNVVKIVCNKLSSEGVYYPVKSTRLSFHCTYNLNSKLLIKHRLVVLQIIS